MTRENSHIRENSYVRENNYLRKNRHLLDRNHSYRVFLSSLFIAMLALTMFAACIGSALAVPVPSGIDGTVYMLDGITPVPVQLSFNITDMNTNASIFGYTGRGSAGRYSVAMQWNLGDNISVYVHYEDVYGNFSTSRNITLDGVMHNVDILMNITLPPVQNSSGDSLGTGHGMHSGGFGSGSGSSGIGYMYNETPETTRNETFDYITNNSAGVINNQGAIDRFNILDSPVLSETLPGFLSPPDRMVYRYVYIGVGAVKNDSSSTGSGISFNVSERWLSDRGLAPSDVVLLSYNNKLREIAPALVGNYTGIGPVGNTSEGNVVLEYSARSDGEGWYAITYKSGLVPHIPAPDSISIKQQFMIWGEFVNFTEYTRGTAGSVDHNVIYFMDMRTNNTYRAYTRSASSDSVIYQVSIDAKSGDNISVYLVSSRPASSGVGSSEVFNNKDSKYLTSCILGNTLTHKDIVFDTQRNGGFFSITGNIVGASGASGISSGPYLLLALVAIIAMLAYLPRIIRARAIRNASRHSNSSQQFNNTRANSSINTTDSDATRPSATGARLNAMIADIDKLAVNNLVNKPDVYSPAVDNLAFDNAYNMQMQNTSCTNIEIRNSLPVIEGKSLRAISINKRKPYNHKSDNYRAGRRKASRHKTSRSHKRGGVFIRNIFFVALAIAIILAAAITLATPPSPQNVKGRIFNNDSTGAANGLPVIINNTNTSQVFSTQVSAPPSPQLAGSYSLTINGSVGDVLSALSYNNTMYGRSSAVLVANSTTVINVVLNMTRPSETNITITYPVNNTLYNITRLFNLTVNISVLGHDASACNVTLQISNQSVINLSSGANSTNYIGDINLTQVMTTSFELAAHGSGHVNITALGSCRSDGVNLQGLNIYIVYNVSVVDNTPPVVLLVAPSNNTVYKLSNNVSLFYNATEDSSIANCSLVINSTLNSTSYTVANGAVQNFTLMMPNGAYSWSVSCYDIAGNLGSSGTYYLNISKPILALGSINITSDNILNAGSTKTIACNATFQDSNSASDIANASAVLYAQGYGPTSPDDNNDHYTNSNCTLFSSAANSSSFSCMFNLLYYANNGTWTCNATMHDVSGFDLSANISTIIESLYAVNMTDGIDFGSVSSGSPSASVTANITNFGNMAINITIEGYALLLGDSTGMNCSDGSNITISRIKFATSPSLSYSQKAPLNGSVQQLNIHMAKQTGLAQVSNSTYWQIDPDPGLAGRICSGYVIFDAQAP